MRMIVELILAGIGLVLSAFFSGSEIAVITANPLQLQKWVSQKKAFALAAMQMYEKRQHYLTVILVGNTLTNILTTTFATIMLTAMGFDWWQIIVMISAAILLFGEVLPKSLIRHRPNSYLLFSAALIKLFGFILRPVARFFEKMIAGLLRLFKSDEAPVNIMVRREEIEQSIFDSYENGVLNADKKKYLDRVFDFSDTSAGEIITPRTDMIALPENSDRATLKKTFIQSGYSKIVIYRENIDYIVGYISLRDILGTAGDIRDIIRPIKFYPESKSIIDLLKEFQRTKTSIAVIVDEYGGTSGLVTMEDIVEEIFGEFDDEYDDGSINVRRLPNGDLHISGRTEVDFLNEQYHVNLPEGEYETIAGYLLEHLDRFPKPGEVITVKQHEFTILKATPKSIDHIKLRHLPTGK